MSAAHAVDAATAASARAGAGGRAATFLESLVTRTYSMILIYFSPLDFARRDAAPDTQGVSHGTAPAQAPSQCQSRTIGPGAVATAPRMSSTASRRFDNRRKRQKWANSKSAKN